jgi:hypothetical protein
MAHVQPKSAHGLEHKKEFKLAEQASNAKENRTRHDEKAPEAKVAREVSQASNAADEETSWQFKMVIGVIALGVLMLILKTIGLF